MGLERHEIEAFLALAEELHFGRTAERLRVSRSHVTQTIQKLERRVGGLLFERTSRKVALTPIGQRLYETLAPAYAQIQTGLEQAVAEAQGIGGVLHVGFSGAIAGRLTVEAAAAFRAQRPDCEVRFHEFQLGDFLHRLRAEEVDVALVCFPVREPGLSIGPVLFTDPPMLAVSSQHPFARRKEVSLEDLARDTLLRPPTSLPEYWRETRAPHHTPSGRPIQHGPAVETISESLALVGAGAGMFMLGAQAMHYYARPNVAYVPISDAPPFEWGASWPTTSTTVRVRAYVEACRQASVAKGGPDGYPGA